MMHILEGEVIGKKVECIHPLQALMPDQFKMPTGKPWLAVITGTCPKFGLAREFVNENKFTSHAKSNGARSRGVWKRWVIEDTPGVIYEFFRKTSWRASERYFFHFVSGEKVKLERDEVCQILSAR